MLDVMWYCLEANIEADSWFEGTFLLGKIDPSKQMYCVIFAYTEWSYWWLGNSSLLAVELLQSCSKPLMCPMLYV